MFLFVLKSIALHYRNNMYSQIVQSVITQNLQRLVTRGTIIYLYKNYKGNMESIYIKISFSPLIKNVHLIISNFYSRRLTNPFGLKQSWRKR